MQRIGFFKKAMLVAGFLAFFVAGYVSTSIVTSCPAEAQVCKCSVCTYTGPSSLASVLGIIYASIIGPALVTAQAMISAYYTLAITAFTEQIISKFEIVASNFVDWFDTFWYYNLRPAMQGMTEQLNTADTDQARAWGGFADSVDLNRTHREQFIDQAQTHREQRPSEDVCVAGTVAGGMARAAAFQRGYNAAAPVEALPRGANNTGTAAASGTASDQKERWDNYTTRYCAKEYNAGAAGCAADAPFVGQDLDVTGQVFMKDTIDVTDADVKKSVDDLISNLSEPFVLDLVSKRSIDSAEGREVMLEREAYKAKRQVVYDALYLSVSRRVPGSDMGAFVKEIRQAAGIDAALISPNPSHNEIMQAMMAERYRTGKYGIGQIDEPENNEREQVVQEAFQAMNWSDYLDLLDRYSLVLAAQAGQEVREMKPFSTRSEAAPLRN